MMMDVSVSVEICHNVWLTNDFWKGGSVHRFIFFNSNMSVICFLQFSPITHKSCLFWADEKSQTRFKTGLMVKTRRLLLTNLQHGANTVWNTVPVFSFFLYIVFFFLTQFWFVFWWFENSLIAGHKASEFNRLSYFWIFAALWKCRQC